MADDVQEASSKSEPIAVSTKEDAETRAARRELKQSTISDSPAAAAAALSNDDNSTRPETPADAPDASQDDDDLKEQVSSPKKKRAHDQLEGDVPAEDTNDTTSVASTDSGKDRATRLEPEKKRHRDEESKEDETKSSEKTSETENDAGKSPAKKESQTSTSAFAASGFGKLAAGASPFASFGGSGSGFGSGKPLASFASPAAPAAPAAAPAAPKLTFGGGSSASPFAGLSTASNGFGGGLGGGLSGGLGGSAFGSAAPKPLGSFAAPGAKPFSSEKPAKPFGAPDSDEEDEEDEDEDDEEPQTEDAERAASPEKDAEEKKRLKLQKIEVNDGESAETTVVSVRSKMFVLDKEAGWKERGAGMLKINVPSGSVDFDDAGAVIPGSFDASSLEDDSDGESKPKVVRLLMRQDQTHRVILNTAIVPAIQFQEKASLKSVAILFTAFEGDEAKPMSVTMRMSAASAKTFMNELSLIQRELQSN